MTKFILFILIIFLVFVFLGFGFIIRIARFFGINKSTHKTGEKRQYYRNNNQRQHNTETNSNYSSTGKKIFSKDEGEYVDYEDIK